MTKPVTARHSRGCWSATFAEQELPAQDPMALRNLTYGLHVITARDDRDYGFIANTCFQVANEPTKLCISVQMGNKTREIIEKTGVFNVSVLTDDVPFETVRHFGMQSSRDTDKFADFADWDRAANEVSYITANTNAMFSCKVLFKKELGSHMLFVGEVTESRVLGTGTSCTYAHYHKAVRPQF